MPPITSAAAIASGRSSGLARGRVVAEPSRPVARASPAASSQICRRPPGSTPSIVQRKLLPRWQLRAAAPARRSAWSSTSTTRSSIATRTTRAVPTARAGRARFAAIVRLADTVDRRQRLPGRLRPPRRGAGRSGPGDPDLHRPRPLPAAGHGRDPGPGLDLVWIGSSSTLQGWSWQRPLWERIAREVPGVRLRVICDRFPDLDPLPVVAVPWSEATEADALAAGDVGISWIPDDLWSRGKCGLKVLQYQAAGLPVLANPVGVHPEMIAHGRRRASSPTRPTRGWRGGPRRWPPIRPARRRMGAAARAAVAADYSVAAWSAAFVDAVSGGRRDPRSTPAARLNPPTRCSAVGAGLVPAGSDRRAATQGRQCADGRHGANGWAGCSSDRYRAGPVGSPVRATGLGLGADRRRGLVGPRRLAAGPARARRAPARRVAARAAGSPSSRPGRTGSSIASTCPRGRSTSSTSSCPGFRAKLRQWFRRGKGRNEGRRTRYLAAIGVPTITPIALGEQRKRKFLLENYLITHAIPETVPLDEFVERRLPQWPEPTAGAGPAAARRRRWRLLTARLHDAGFVHQDFHPGNILVRIGGRRPAEPGDDRPRRAAGQLPAGLARGASTTSRC